MNSKVFNQSRNPNFELMRILNCLLIVTHHHQYFLFKDMDPFSKLFVTIMFIPSINSFIYITGYFGNFSRWRPSRVLILLFQITISNLIACLIVFYSNNEKIQISKVFSFEVLFHRNWFHHCYMVFYFFIPMTKYLSHFFYKRLKYFIFLLCLCYFLSLTKFARYFPTGRGYSVHWFIFLYILSYTLLTNQHKPPSTKEFFIYLLSYILSLLLSWNFQNIDLKQHPYLYRYFPNFPNQCNIYFCHCCWTTILISIFYFKVFQNLMINNKIIQSIIFFISKHLDVLFMFHHYKNGSTYIFMVIGNLKFFKTLNLSPMRLLLLQSIIDFMLCFAYSIVFHSIFDHITKSSLAVDFFNKFDDFLKRNFNINENRTNDEEMITDNFEKVDFELV